MIRWIARELRDWWVGQRHPESVAFDRAHGIETRHFDLFNYEPSLPSVVAETLDALDVDPREFAFVDLGSGKGRVVLLAAQRGFREVIGIEHRRRLHRIAEKNLARIGADGLAPVRLVRGDAGREPLPAGPIVLYLFNPFPAELLIGILARVEDRARLVYVNPLAAEELEALGWEEVARKEHADVVRSWRIYAGPWG